MKRIITSFAIAIIMSVVSGSISYAQPGKWSTAYYAGWSQGYNNSGTLPAQNIDFGAVTHIMHFALVPRADGSLDDASNSVTAYNSNAIISAAHAAGKKVLITVGGFYTDGSFRSATSSSVRSLFVKNLVDLMKTRGYDGIDVDWEPLASGDAQQFTAFITELRTAMDAVSPRPLLTAATAWGAPIFAQVKDKFDQINLMTYDLAGAWPGWVTWHNAPITDGGFTFPSTGNPPPTIDGMITEFTAAGIPASKLGIGIDFYGYVWSGGSGTPSGGATAPRQSWSTPPTVQANVPYSTIMDTYYQSQFYRFDNSTGASYLSIDNSGSANDKFISYDDEATIAAKYNYIRSKGLGGAIIWELGGGYRSNLPAGQKDLLLQAVKQALAGTAGADVTPPTVSITSPLNGSSLTGTTILTASASDNVGVTGVQFKVDGVNEGAEVIVPPFTRSLNISSLSAGTHTISAVARDAAGNTQTASATVTVVLSLPDIILPQVSLTSPVNGTTVSGTVNIAAAASDNVGVAGVQFSIDGVNYGGEDVTAPYSLSWNSAQLPNGPHVVSAVARDAAGNKSAADVTVTVSNPAVPPSADLMIYTDALQSPWINSSWNNAVIFNSTEQVYSGSGSMKSVITGAWGGLSLHYGNWGSTGINPAQYSKMNFALFAATSGTQISVFAENDLGQSFPRITYGSITAGQWTLISIPIDQLNPAGHVINRITVQEVSGSVRTFYVDDLRLIGTATIVPTAADTIKPTISFTSPLTGESVTGSLIISANAADNKKVSGVQFLLDGANFGNEILSSPYAVSWNTLLTANGPHTIKAVVRDSSGNTNSAIITVSVSNVVAPPISSADSPLYDDSIASPWINTSWNAILNTASSEKKYSGNRSIKVVQNAWGGVRFHSGAWGATADIKSDRFKSVSFTVNGGPSGISLGVWFENDGGAAFPSVKYVWVPANEWVKFNYPMSQLNPNNLSIHSLVIQDMSGRSKTYYIDEVKFIAWSTSLSKEGTVNSSEGISHGPLLFGIEQNYPNPFNPSTAIRYSVPFTASVLLEVFNMAGQRVATLVENVQTAGEYGATFDGTSHASGVYFSRLTAVDQENPNRKPLVLTRRMILMK